MDPDMNARLLAEVTTLLRQQQELMTKLVNRPPAEKRVEGISMPKYSGSLGESLELFLDQARLFFEAKDIDYMHSSNSRRVLAMMVSNLQGQAAAWYVTQQSSIDTIDELADALRREFIPADLQERLRDALYKLKQREGRDLADYVTRYRQLIMRVKDMSEIDKIALFTRGLVTQTRAEVVYRRCTTVRDAISVAMEYERAHPQQQQHGQGNHRFRGRFAEQRENHGQRSHPGPEPMEIGHGQFVSRGECFQRNLCFFCKKPGHRMANCRQRGKTDRRPAEGAGVIARHRVGNMKESNEPEVFDHLTINAAALSGSGRHQLLRKPGTVGNNAVIILLDSGADHNVIRKGLSTNVLRRKQAKAERFDGSTTTVQWINEVQESIDFDGFILADMVFSEWDLPPSHDVIFGKPFFDEYNPVINWRTHEVQLEPGLQSLHAAFQAEMDFFESAVSAADPDEERNAQERGAFFLEDANPDRLCNDDRSFLQEHELSPDMVEWLQTHPTPRSTWLPPAHISDTTFEKNLRLGSYEEVYRVKVSASAASEVVPGFLESLLAEYADVFPTELPDDLPKERAVEFELTMKPGAQPSSRAPFRLSRTEQDALDVFKDATTGVAPSRSQWIKSGNSALPIRWVVDYRYINSQTEVPKIPLPRIDELFDQMVGCAVFSTIDLAQGYHQMRIATNSRKYTAFRTDKETYHWCVAPMGLSGMPGVWSRLMRLLFGRFAFVVVYLDDLCIYSHSEAEHCEHLRVVFDVLRSERLFARRSKCVFGAASVDFLDHTVSQEGLCVDKRKTHAIEQYPAPTTVKQLQSFLGLAGYYRRFIYGFAEIVLPLSELVKKVATWRWGEEQQRAFLQLKLHLQQAPDLQLPDFTKPFVVTTDASGRCCGGVLSQQTEGHDLPIAFFSKKFSDAEQNWPVHEQELFAIKLALSKWRHYLHGRPFDVHTDNSACTWFMAHPQVSGKLARWLDFFGQYTFTLHHVKGEANVVADALSRPAMTKAETTSMARTQNYPMVHDCGGKCREMEYSLRRHQISSTQLGLLQDTDARLILDDDFRGRSGVAVPVTVPHEVYSMHVGEMTISVTNVHLDAATKRDFAQGYRRDSLYTGLGKSSPSKTIPAGELKWEQGLVYLENDAALRRLCVPDYSNLRVALLAEFHDGPVSAHPGIRRTQLKLCQWYFWPTLLADVKHYVQSCSTCARFKSSSLRKNGELMPLPVPSECWEIVGIDFVTGLPASSGYDAIIVCIDHLSKRPKYTPTYTTVTGAQAAAIFFEVVVRNHGLPAAIVSDRDPKFTGSFWQELMRIMGVKLRMATAFRAQADGQTERQNRVLEDGLRCMVSLHGTNWSDVLSTVEYAHATLVSASTKMSPFQIDTGRVARTPGVTTETRNDYAVNFIQERQKIIDKAQKNLLEAKARQKTYYDQGRSGVQFQEGEWVYLSTRNLPLAHAARGTRIDKDKLVARFVGPFQIINMLNKNVAKLKLPKSMSRLHNSFNVDVLRHVVESPAEFLSRPLPKVSPVHFSPDNDDGDLHVIERLIKQRTRRRKRQYLVHWQGLPDTEDTWENEAHIRHVVHWKHLLKELRARRR